MGSPEFARLDRLYLLLGALCARPGSGGLLTPSCPNPKERKRRGWPWLGKCQQLLSLEREECKRNPGSGAIGDLVWWWVFWLMGLSLRNCTSMRTLWSPGSCPPTPPSWPRHGTPGRLSHSHGVTVRDTRVSAHQDSAPCLFIYLFALLSGKWPNPQPRAGAWPGPQDPFPGAGPAAQAPLG